MSIWGSSGQNGHVNMGFIWIECTSVRGSEESFQSKKPLHLADRLHLTLVHVPGALVEVRVGSELCYGTQHGPLIQLQVSGALCPRPIEHAVMYSLASTH